MAFDKPIAAITIFCEASSEEHAARLGVAYTILNRLKLAPHFGETVAEICLRRMQFSEWNGDRIDNANLMRGARCPDNDSVMQDCEVAYDQAAFASVPDPTHGATHYHSTDIDPPSWTVGAVRTEKLGRLIFYRGVR